MDQNALMPQGADAPAGSGPEDDPGAQGMPGQAPPPPADPMVQYQKLQVAEKTLGIARSGLAKLAELGDTVTPEDAMKEVGLLVAAGLSPVSVAGMLADMPQQGDLLAEWVKKQEMDVAKRGVQLGFIMTGLRHHLATGALQGLVIHHIQETGMAGEVPPPEALNG